VIPSTTKSSAVRVPVLSKQQMSTLPAKGILNGSVQYTSKNQHTNSILHLTFQYQFFKQAAKQSPLLAVHQGA
jgi:hypothetical protein